MLAENHYRLGILFNLLLQFTKKIKANQPEVLTADNDFLGTITKGDMIKGFLNSLLDREETDIQMIALYGEWGSGKTSLMNYIKDQLDKEDAFKTVFFPAWEMEKDDNLSLSLLESIIESEDGVDKTDIKEAFLAIGKGIGKGLSAKIGPINLNFKEVIQSVEEYNKSITDDSALKRIKQFKEKYSELEENILNKTQSEKMIIFIDDLDRCEPENVLNLLSAIKLFFTFGKRTIFICGLDEKAVDEAVKVRYKDVIKSGEYMEKIFDISFDMPKPDIYKMLNYYFEDAPDKVRGIYNFFEVMHFTNPRHVKKVLNKYLLLRYYILSGIDNAQLIPDQNTDFFRYLTLFIIMLYKFEPDNFEMLRDYDEKISTYFEKGIEKSQGNEIDSITNMLIAGNVKVMTISDMRSSGKFNENYAGMNNEANIKENRFLAAFITLFAPIINEYINLNVRNVETYKSQFKGKYNLPSNFCSFINSNKELIPVTDVKYRLWNIFDMAERYL